ncbi:MAG: hypothetical protein OXI96_07540 [Acidimicrobiaceae bacterium]|nr:hypothetical protein [Acidimicrobiaceae bacterium]
MTLKDIFKEVADSDIVKEIRETSSKAVDTVVPKVKGVIHGAASKVADLTGNGDAEDNKGDGDDTAEAASEQDSSADTEAMANDDTTGDDSDDSDSTSEAETSDDTGNSGESSDSDDESVEG